MKLADSLLANYTGSIAGLPADAWIVQCGDGTEQDVKIAYRRNDDGSNTAIVCTSATFLLPLPMRRVFDLLKNNLLRVKVCQRTQSLRPATWQQQHGLCLMNLSTVWLTDG